MRKIIAERVRGFAPDLAEAIESDIFTNKELAEELRGRTFDYPHVMNAFYDLVWAASKLEEL